MSDYIYNLGCYFNQVATSHSTNTAIYFLNNAKTNYAELESLSNQIAHFLQNRGIKTGQILSIFHDKSIHAYAIMIAGLKMGVTYTNLDFHSPLPRLEKMLHVCQPSISFCHHESNHILEKIVHPSLKIVNYSSSEFIEEISTYPTSLPKETLEIHGNTPAYLMFTSGSTGFPKGVIISHANILNFISWSKTTFNTTKDDVFTNINPMFFDNSVFDFYSSLFVGASLIPVPEILTKTPRKLLDQLNSLNPTIWFSVPSMLVFILKMRALKETDLLSLRIVSFGGEGFPKNQLRNLWNIWSNRVLFKNVYGPTECTCICSSYNVSSNDMENDELLPLGPIAPNFSFFVMNDGKLVNDENEMGELYIGGPNVGLGYYNNSEKTKEVFIQNPFTHTHNTIIYKSGDLVKYSKTKNLLYFCGRTDNQIKRMGYRIELEEIENAIGSLTYINENAVIYIKDPDDNGRIIACISSEFKDENRFFQDISLLLPSYMLPNSIKFFEQLPKNQNGKIDRIKLKELIINE